MSVRLSGLRKRFNGPAILDDISLEVADGEFLALLGPSGSGKTTLLRVIAGLEFADAGTIEIDGRDMGGVPARERRAGFVFQHYALFRHMTVAENIAFGLNVRPRATRPDRAHVSARVGELLNLVQMPELAARYPDQLSGGQRQRVALARALAIEPRLLLLDEPFGALDARVRKDLRLWLRRLHDRLGLTTIFVTHDQGEALELADRVAVMHDGRIAQVDTPARLYHAPASAFVHAFLGDVLQFDCLVREGKALFFGLALEPLPTDCPPGPARAVIRTHQVTLDFTVPESGLPVVTGVHASGATERVEIDLGLRRIEVTLPETAALPALGAVCRLDMRAARVYPDDRSGGQILSSNVNGTAI